MYSLCEWWEECGCAAGEEREETDKGDREVCVEWSRSAKGGSDRGGRGGGGIEDEEEESFRGTLMATASLRLASRGRGSGE